MTGFCEACRVFDISRAAFHSAPFKENLMHQLGFFYEVEKRRHCPLCSLLSETIRKGPAQDEDAFDGSRVMGQWIEIVKDPEDPNSSQAGLTFYLDGKYQDLKMPINVRSITSSNEEAVVGSGRLIDSSSKELNVQLAASWIHLCETTHPCRSVPLNATRAGRLPSSFTVIDARQRCLFEPASDCRFLALSYVWGSSNRFVTSLQKMRNMKRPGSLDAIWHLLAPPIRDAIILTEKLGERFIWIDALCIPQTGDDGCDVAADNIRSMDSIYRHAVCTIIAADERAPDEGLAGIGSLKRNVKQFTAELLPSVHVLARYSPQTLMQRSRYRTRGWTFQEEQLASRSLIITNNQIYFSCSSSAYSEDIHESSKPDHGLVSQHRSNKLIAPGAASDPSQTYFNAVQALMQRDLRFPEDILRAFAGAEAVLSQMLGCDLVQGLPTCIFDVALLWQPHEKLARREGFPSWSWAGYVGQIEWRGDTVYGLYGGDDGGLAGLNRWQKDHTWIEYYCYGEDCPTLRPVWDAHQRTKIGPFFWPLKGDWQRPAIGYFADAENDQDSPMTPYGRATNMSKSPLHLLSSDKGPRPSLTELAVKVAGSEGLKLLQPIFFTTLSTRMTIKTSPNSYMRYGSVDPVWVNRGRLVFLLYAELKDHHESYTEDNPCGYVLLDDTFDAPDYDLSEQEFLLMSEAHSMAEYGSPHARHKPQKYYGYNDWEDVHVMMVEHRRLENGAKVTERLGIGRVLREVVEDVGRVEVVDVALT